MGEMSARLVSEPALWQLAFKYQYPSEPSPVQRRGQERRGEERRREGRRGQERRGEERRGEE